MPAQALLFSLAGVARAVAEANLGAVVDVAVELLEDVDMDVDTEDDTSLTHQGVPIAVWITTQLRNAERHQNRPATPLESVKAVIIVPKVDTYVQIAQ